VNAFPAHHARTHSRAPIHDTAAAPTDQRRMAAPLLAIAGVCGGAGASTLSYLLARHAAANGPGPVLVCDTGGATGGLAAQAAIASPRTLTETAAQAPGPVEADGGRPPWTVVPGTRGHQLRVIATGPRLRTDGDPRSLTALLQRLRTEAGHALVIVDCGTLQRAPDRLALRLATHVAWVLPASAHGRDRARRLFAALPASLDARELLIVRQPPDRGPASLRTLTELAQTRQAPLVLLGDLPREPGRALAAAQVSLQAILGRLTP
jgi:hypothetical protein